MTTTLVLLMLVLQIALTPYQDAATNILETIALLALSAIAAFEPDGERLGVEIFLALLMMAVLVALARGWIAEEYSSIVKRYPRLCCVGRCRLCCRDCRRRDAEDRVGELRRSSDQVEMRDLNNRG